MMKRLPVVCNIALIALAFARCDDRQDAVAADAPKLEIKAEVAPPKSTVVAAPIDGRIETIHVREGAAVKAGDLLVSIVNPAVERDLAYARTQLALAEYRLRNASRAPVMKRDDEREQADATIVRNRKSRVERYRALFATHDVSKDELEIAEAEYAAALRDYAAEREARRVAPPAADAGLLKLELEKARAEMAFVEDRKRQLAVYAPVAGTVIRVAANAGEGIYVRDPLLEVANTTSAQVRGTIAPELLRYIKTGVPVDVKVFTVPPRHFVEPVATIADTTIIVAVPNPDGVLHAGTPALITVR
ncbi:MAG TPA: efflux RND transporter periplasmic adaptor subunit [Thermoanaerobaculia bacterium]|nr:efflux RND transporter periplasmic adaptor subunit [Thermoanaerobaculia bacterium]